MPNLVVIGGGFAATSLVRALRGRLPADWRLTLVAEESYTTFNPMLAEAVGAAVFPEQIVAPLREVLDMAHGDRFVMGAVDAADRTRRIIGCRSLAGRTELSYDHLVIAIGNRARLDFIEGMRAHALPLKTVGDAMEIRNTVLRRIAQIELETDPAVRAALGSFIVIGGGFSGVEVAGELVDSLRGIRRYYPEVRAEEVSVTLVHDMEGLLPELPAALGVAARRSLEARGVRVLTKTRVVAISADGVRCADDAVLSGRCVICTIGTRPNPLIEQLGLPVERGRLQTAADMSVVGAADVWAVGDCALIINARDGKPSPPTAQFATRQGKQLAANLLRRIRGQPTQAFRYQARGTMAAIGYRRGVAEVFGLRLTGLPAWLLWRAYYLSQLPTLGRKVRVYVEWTWGMFFPTDITHLRFTRSRDSDS